MRYVEKYLYGRGRQTTDGNTSKARCGKVALCMQDNWGKYTDTRLKYLITIYFPLQEGLRERALC
jgi:hypothetical protein